MVLLRLVLRAPVIPQTEAKGDGLAEATHVVLDFIERYNAGRNGLGQRHGARRRGADATPATVIDIHATMGRTTVAR